MPVVYVPLVTTHTHTNTKEKGMLVFQPSSELKSSFSVILITCAWLASAERSEPDIDPVDLEHLKMFLMSGLQDRAGSDGPSDAAFSDASFGVFPGNDYQSNMLNTPIDQPFGIESNKALAGAVFDPIRFDNSWKTDIFNGERDFERITDAGQKLRRARLLNDILDYMKAKKLLTADNELSTPEHK